MDCVIRNISSDWLNIVYGPETKPMLNAIFNELKDIKNITPKPSEWFNWCRYTPLNEVNAVIIAQDPYQTYKWADGLCFSCKSVVPHSLKNIFKCLLRNNLIEKIPETGDLVSWAQQGVLLMNISFSTLIGIAGSHIKLWSQYTQKVIRLISNYHCDRNMVVHYMLWGNYAKSLASYINKKHIILNWIHPSPLAQKTKDKLTTFKYCDHFTIVNTYLKEIQKIICWNSVNDIDWRSTAFNQIQNLNTIDENPTESDIENDIPSLPDLTQAVTYETAESKLNMTPTHHIIFTDGSAHPNNKSVDTRAGYAAYFVSGPLKSNLIYGNLDISGIYASNIRAEMYAVIRAFEFIQTTSKEWSSITIITDCEFVINLITVFMPKWSPSKIEEKANPDLSKRLFNIYNALKQLGDIKFIHVKSHNKDGWKTFNSNSYENYCYKNNKYVDEMCGFARTQLVPSDEVISIIEII